MSQGASEEQPRRGALSLEVAGRRLTLDDLAYLNRVTTVGHVLPNVAHELNNALQVVGGLVEMLAARADLPQDVLDKIGRIGGQASRAAAMIRDLVAFARRDHGGVQIVDLARVIDQALAMRRYHLARARVGVILRGAEPARLMTRADAHYVQQLVLNLLINAEHSMAGRETAQLIVELWGTPDAVAVSIADNGPGMPLNVQARVLDPFFTTKGVAAGLGLTVAAALAEQQGGRLDLASTHDGGTRATLTLPRAGV